MTRFRPGNAVLTSRGVTWCAIVTDSLLSAVKIAAGVLFGSQAILADGMHSASDLVTDFVVLGGLAVSKRPADVDHHYGHRRVTTLVAMFVAGVLLGAAVWIAYTAIMRLNAPGGELRAGLPFCIAAAAIPIKELLYQITKYAGRTEKDMSLLANAWHHRTDAMSSVAAALGLAGVLLGGPQWAMLDALTAVVLAAFLIVVGVRIMRTSADELADRAPSPETLEGIRRAVVDTEGVIGFHAFRARQMGGKVEMDVHVQVDPNLSVGEGHSIASAVRRTVRQTDDSVVTVTVHVEPAELPDTSSRGV